MFNQKLIFLIINLILINKIGISLSIENLFGDECICDGRCKECIIPETAKICKLCSGHYGLDFKKLGIDNYNSELNLQLPHRTCICPANYLQINSGNNVSNPSSEVVFVRLECSLYLIDDRLCIGINPQLFFMGINLTEYWLIIGSILSITLILCCAIISLHKNNCCFNSERLIQIYGQNFPLSTIRQSRTESSISNNYTNDNIFSEIRSNSSLPPTYEEVININIGSNSDQHLSKHLINANIIESSDHLPTYEDAVRTDDSLK
jgi:hypothetical protein